MTKVLHILNGDSIVQTLKDSGLQGEIVVWREMLCEGEVCSEVGSDEFWKLRYQYFQQEMGIPKLEYFDKIIKEIIKLDDLSNYNEVVLWFEYDLFCQVNLMALCSYLLHSYRKDINYYLICTGKEKEKTAWQPLSYFKTVGFVELYENKLKLTRNNLIFAQKSWEVIARNNKEELSNFNFNGCPKFRYLSLAMKQQLKRFPGKNGLNQIEQKILEIINLDSLNKQEIIESLLNWQQEETVYGFTDLQYKNYLQKLHIYYKIEDATYQLNSHGKSKFLANEN